MQTIANLVRGRFERPATGRYLDNVEPATGRVYSQVPESGAEDVSKAVAAAREAFPAWSGTPARERSRLLLRLADLVEANLARLAEAESIDTGKPVSLARAVDIPRAAENLRFFATAVLHTSSHLHDT